MKKVFAAALLLAATISCIKESAYESSASKEKVTVRVSIPESTKVSLTEAADHSCMALGWQSGDALSINGEIFTIKDGFSAHQAEFEGNAPEGDSFNIIYPGKYTSAEAFGARSYTSQVQDGNASTAHLEYNAMLQGVSEYATPEFVGEWAAAKGGVLVQNAVLQLRLQLPATATTATSVTICAADAIFPTTNAGGSLVKEYSLGLKNVSLPANHILEAYLMLPSAGVTVPDKEGLSVAVTTPEGIFVKDLTLDAQLWAGGGQYTIQTKVQDENRFEIHTADDLIEFRDGVNSGAFLWKYKSVKLMADLDLSGVTSWTPIGNAVAPWTSYNPVVTSGSAFLGSFDGNSHRIKNLKLSDAVSTVGAHFGLFGYLGKGAVVQNFIIDESCSLTVTSSVSHSVGMIAGVLYDATVRDVTSYAPMTYKGGASGYFHMALIGGLYANEDGCTVDSVHNYGAVNAENTANLNAGATGLHVAGIVGFANAGNGSNVISSCNNYGSLTSQAGRTAGILGAANKNTAIKLCENHGDQLNTMPSNGGGRLGNICCLTNNGSSIEGCKNYGKLVSTTAGRVGGIVSLPNAGEYKDNENYGEILSDSDYRGVFFGYVNAAAAWKGGKASGKVGKYNGGEPVYDVYPESDKVKYLGKDGSSGKATFTDVVIDIATGEIPSDPEIDIDAGFRIFFIGNSFTKDAVEHLPKILKAAGLSDIQMVHMYYGGRTIPEYNEGWSTVTDYHCYVCNPGQDSWTDLSGKSLAVIAATGKWDIVTIQEHTGRKLAWGWTDDEKSAVQGLVDKVKAAQSANGGSPALYYILSQAYHNLAKSNDTPKPFSNTDEMWTVISAQGKSAVEECGFDGVISTGAMLQNLRTSGLNNSLGLTRDGYHMDYGIARYGASCTVFETIIGPYNGNVKLDGNTFRTVGDSEGNTAITDTRAPIALKAARYAIAKPYEVTDMEGEGGGEPIVVPDNISISNAAELTAFAARVNSGDEKAVKATVTLTADIDCSSLTSWTPIAYCTLSSWSGTTSALSGNSFLGSFDGQNHKIKNLKMNFTPTENNGTWGFFGAIGKDAVVKNIEFDSSCSMSISTGNAGVFGTLAGFVTDASVENIKCAATISGGGTSALADNNASGRVAVGGVVGWVMAGSKDITLSKLHFSGKIGTSEAPFSKGGNTGNGGNGVMLGGVVGVSTTAGSTRLVTLSELVNDGEIHAATGRVSGVCSTLQQYTVLKSCTNNGDVYFYTAGGYRPGNITCIAAAGCILEDCLNTGDLIAPDTDSAAGVICLVNNDNVKITRCHSKGAAIVCKGFDLETPSVKYAGLLYGQCSKNKAEFSGCSVNGKVGKTEAGAVAVTADNYFSFVGQANANNKTINQTNITFATD